MKPVSIKKWHENAALVIRNRVAKEAGIDVKYLGRVANGAKVPVRTAVKIVNAAEKYLPQMPLPCAKTMVSRENAKAARDFVEITND